MDFPIKNGGSFHSYVTVYQGGTKKKAFVNYDTIYSTPYSTIIHGGDLPDITGNSRYQLHTTRWEPPF